MPRELTANYVRKAVETAAATKPLPRVGTWPHATHNAGIRLDHPGALLPALDALIAQAIRERIAAGYAVALINPITGQHIDPTQRNQRFLRLSEQISRAANTARFR